MNFYKITISDEQETIEVEMLKRNVKADETVEDFDYFDDINYFNDEGYYEMTLYAFNKAQALYLGMEMLKEFAVFDFQEDMKEWQQEEMEEEFKERVLNTIKKG